MTAFVVKTTLSKADAEYYSQCSLPDFNQDHLNEGHYLK